LEITKKCRPKEERIEFKAQHVAAIQDDLILTRPLNVLLVILAAEVGYLSLDVQILVVFLKQRGNEKFAIGGFATTPL
jgi:hypothetical protein